MKEILKKITGFYTCYPYIINEFFKFKGKSSETPVKSTIIPTLTLKKILILL